MKSTLTFLSCLFSSFLAFSQNQVVNISPAKPQIGEQVIISYQNDENDNNTIPVVVFSYSNFFELPGTLRMTRKGNRWEASFMVPRYAKYGSFYIKHGDKISKPAKGHYEMIFYNGSKPVFDTYLYKSYSLAAQLGKSDSLKYFSDQLYKQELILYPNNYAAKLRQLVSMMEQDKPNALRHKNEALKLINSKLQENPTIMGNINQVTMGYLIINEGARIDSLKEVLLKKYPGSEVAYEYMYEDAYKTKDEEERIAKMKKLLNYTTKGESSTYSGIHEHLFAYYAKRKDEKNALESAAIVAAVKNPWQPKEIKNIAAVLAENNIGLDAAQMYAEKALSMVKEYPFGVVRYFPEYGYIPGYVDNRNALIDQQRGDILSLLGNIYARQNKMPAAEIALKKALEFSKSIEVYKNLAVYYQIAKLPKDAFAAYRNILLQLPTDNEIRTAFKSNYVAYSGSEQGYEQELNAMIAEWETLNLSKILKTAINKPAPLFSEVYDMEGKLIDPASLKGKIIVADFWATWCVPCIEGFPYMQKVFDRYKDNKDVVFMIMNSGSKNTLQDAQEWVKKNGFTFPFYYNDRKLATAFNIVTIPTTFVIDGDGNVQYKTVGFEGPIMEPKLGLQIKSLLK